MTELHDDRCRVTIGDGPCNCPSAVFANRATRIYHEAAEGYRGVPLKYLSMLAPLRSWLNRIAEAMRSKRYLIVKWSRRW